ncbi:MAG: C45 family autoproteolytic acyltransferase/hydrolase [Actinomycetia bacterium]|nr:C45 family autoproteolytic acyltransferase/hydrolase [Actinomycetes bacterium]
MTTQPTSPKSLTTPELAGQLTLVCEELGRRSDHDAAQLLRTIEQLGRSMGDLGRCLGALSWTAPTHRQTRSSPTAARAAECRTSSLRRPSMVEPVAVLVPVVLSMQGVHEDRPGPAWSALLEATWPSYRAWYASEGWDRRSTLEESRSALEQHLPELLPMWQHLVRLAGDDSDVARVLALWNPPAFAPGCSQLVASGQSRALLRNYDYDPALFEGVSLSSRWGERRVIGTSDCLWGLLDGMNDRGLAVSLTFGGLPGTGDGFAIPLVVRYLLEVCDSVADARRVIDRIPVAASYNLTMTDRSGAVVTAFVGPGRVPEYFDMPLATNHRGLVPDRPDLARRFRSVERQDVLRLLDQESRPADVAAEEFLSPSLRSTDFEGGFGTIYTADYRPDDGVVTYRWPGATWRRTFASEDDEIRVQLR